ncbi:MAG TPA: hypothetical protein VGR25_08010 [bacterium]|nr:hypothetical protein [bacterium]
MNSPSERRFFPATLLAGRLYLDGPNLAYLTESQVNKILNPDVGGRRIETAEELAGVLLMTAGFPSVRVWIAEGLEQASRQSTGQSSNCR